MCSGTGDGKQRSGGTAGTQNVPEKGSEAGKGLEHKSLRSWGCLAWRSVKGDLIALYKSLAGGCSHVAIDLFFQVPSGGTSGIGPSSVRGGLYWMLKKTIFSTRMISGRNRKIFGSPF